ncbi:hypothetical protein B0A48_18690 [Cryoendolithus antarcticus]|uniref:Amine oxidase domain-containing protein n=1 Tax=Cryoendolithus antarcticus TaxID=1507870 RepID=A0A1V8S986_9PEZI|nr:hypothetical protein B0A48_18690 [Cryoendolithus antarcticus]
MNTGPDFPFDTKHWVESPFGLGIVPKKVQGTEVGIIGAGMAGTAAGYELMKLGMKSVMYESAEIGGRLRTWSFNEAPGTIADLGGMRFSSASTLFHHYVKVLGLQTKPFPNPLTAAAGSTVIELEGERHYAESPGDLPLPFHEVADAWIEALRTEAQFAELQEAMRTRDLTGLKSLWNHLVLTWDDRSFFDFVTTSRSFAALTFRHRELFGQVGFGTGGWDTDFSHSMLEILRVVITNLEGEQHLVIGGAAQVPRRLWSHAPDHCAYWPSGTSLSSLNDGKPRPEVTRIARSADGQIMVVDAHGGVKKFQAVLVTCQNRVLVSNIDCEQSLFSPQMWTALNKTHYMPSSKVFVVVDRPFWKDKDQDTGRDVMSMTLTDRLTRSTYLFDSGEKGPAVICLSYCWMKDALGMLPHSVERRVELALSALQEIYPGIDIGDHIIGEPITVSWEADRNFLGAFKCTLPGHYRYDRRIFTHFMQRDMQARHRGIFVAGDDKSWTPGWVEGAITTSMNAVWGIMTHLGGRTSPENPGPGDLFDRLQPLLVGD